MTEIGKYRGLTLDTKQWVKGYYVKCRHHHYILEPYDKGGYDDRWQEDWLEVDPETVGQFTGLHDKKRTKEYPEGQEIYGGFDNKGGDILITCREEYQRDGWKHWVVEWNTKIAAWQLRAACGFVVRLTVRLGLKDYEVIGNIYQAPELMEKENGKRNTSKRNTDC